SQFPPQFWRQITTFCVAFCRQNARGPSFRDMTAISTEPTTSDTALVRERLDSLLDTNDPRSSDDSVFWGAQFDAGLAWVHFPEGRGGLGVSPKLQQLINERITDGGGHFPNMVNPMGVGMAAPTIVTHVSEDQQDRDLRRIFTVE